MRLLYFLALLCLVSLQSGAQHVTIGIGSGFSHSRFDFLNTTINNKNIDFGFIERSNFLNYNLSLGSTFSLHDKIRLHTALFYWKRDGFIKTIQGINSIYDEPTYIIKTWDSGVLINPDYQIYCTDAWQFYLGLGYQKSIRTLAKIHISESLESASLPIGIMEKKKDASLFVSASVERVFKSDLLLKLMIRQDLFSHVYARPEGSELPALKFNNSSIFLQISIPFESFGPKEK